MKVVFLVGQLTGGGLERQLYYLLSQLRHKQYDIYCIAWNTSEADFYHDYIKPY